jgi:hypothetical protein
VAWTVDVVRRHGCAHALYLSCSALGSTILHALWRHMPALPFSSTARSASAFRSTRRRWRFTGCSCRPFSSTPTASSSGRRSSTAGYSMGTERTLSSSTPWRSSSPGAQREVGAPGLMCPP